LEETILPILLRNLRKKDDSLRGAAAVACCDNRESRCCTNCLRAAAAVKTAPPRAKTAMKDNNGIKISVTNPLSSRND